MRPGSRRRVDQGVRVSGPSGSVAAKQPILEGPDGASLNVWLRCALVRPSRRDFRCVGHARSRCRGRRSPTAVIDRRVRAARAGLSLMRVLAVGHGWRACALHDAPCFGRVTMVAGWCGSGDAESRRVRRPRSARRTTWRRPRMALTGRAERWAVGCTQLSDTTVSALAPASWPGLAHGLGCDRG